MKKFLYSNVDENEIYEKIIDKLNYKAVMALIKNSVVLKFKLKNKDIDEKEEIRKLYKKDINFKRNILKIWNSDLAKESKYIKDIDKYIENLLEKRNYSEIFEYCTILWSRENEELNTKGNRLYKNLEEILEEREEHMNSDIYEDDYEIYEDDYEEVESDEDDSEGEFREFKKTIFNLSFGDLIKETITLKAKVDSLEEENYELKEIYEDENNKKLERLINSKLEDSISKKDFKETEKKIVEIRKDITNLTSEISEIKKDNEKIKKDNEEIKKGIEAILKSLEKTDINKNFKVLTKNLVDSQNDMKNSLKGGVVESIGKRIESSLKTMEGKIIDKIEVKENILSKQEALNEESKIARRDIRVDSSDISKETKRLDKGEDKSNGMIDILEGIRL